MNEVRAISILGDGDGMQVSCTLNFAGEKKFICILRKKLKF